MSMFEWLGESYNPGSVGRVDVGGRTRGNRSRIDVLVCFGLTVLFLGFLIYFVLGISEVRSAAGLVGSVLVTVIYLFLGYTVHPTPDTSNVGWLGGLCDHPFRYSDDINRFLIFFTILLWPGRFFSESLVDTGRLVAHATQFRRTRVEFNDPDSEAKPCGAANSGRDRG